MTTIAEPECSKRRCVHFRLTDPGDHPAICLPAGLACDAFPAGIPHDIAYGRKLHLKIDPRQVGTVVFERSTVLGLERNSPRLGA